MNLRPLVGALAFALLATLGIPVSAGAEPALPAGFQDEVVFKGIEQPTNFAFAKDGRVFVTTKPGQILVYSGLEDETPEIFADLRGDVYDNGDRGLLGLALDPKFTEGRPYVYALYTWDHVLGDPATPKYGTAGTSGDPDCPAQNSSSSCLVSGKLIRLTAVGNVGSGPEVLLEGWCQQFSSHSIGDLQFGPEGALYVSGGDGAAYESIPDYGQLGTGSFANGCGDPPGVKGTPLSLPNAEGGALRAQNLKLLNGAILRINPDTGAAWPGNPLAGSSDPSGNTQRTVAKGFRNPFRFTFDPVNGEIYTGNVGSSEIEEVDRFPVPPTTLYNSGWPCYEGIQRQFEFKELGLNVCSALYGGEPSSTSQPFFSYSHLQSVVPNDECPFDSGSAIGGDAFYEGDQFPPEYKGGLFFADPVRGCVWVMQAGPDGKPDPTKTSRFMREGKIYPGVKIAEGPDGYLYYADLFSEEGLGAGEIHRIRYAPGAPTARLEANPAYGRFDPASHDLEVTFDASASSDPSSEALTYEWDLDGNGTFESFGGATRTAIYSEEELEEAQADHETGNRVVAVRVQDGEGLNGVARVTVYPGDQPPVPTITGPTSDFRWSVGDLIKLNADAIDVAGNPITTPLPYYWQTRLAHCPDSTHPTACHVHPLQTFAGIRRPEFIAPQHDYPSYIEAILRVSDERGLSGAARIEIQPRTDAISVSSSPPGIPVSAASTEAATPFAIDAIDKSEILLSAPVSVELDGKEYDFSSWSDGGTRAHPILVGEATSSYKASYTTDALPKEVEPPGLWPQTWLGKHPSKRTRSTTARFIFHSDQVGSRFRCKIDKRAFAPCRSPKIYRNLKPTRHTLLIEAVNESGLIDPTPIKFSWKILRQPKP